MGREFVHLEERRAAARKKSGCTINPFSSSEPMFVYPYGTFYDMNKERGASPNPEGHDIIVYVHTEDQERAIGSLEGVFVARKPIDVYDSPGANIPCPRAQMTDFEMLHDGRFTPFDDKK